jgi:hypothetical protein
LPEKWFIFDVFSGGVWRAKKKEAPRNCYIGNYPIYFLPHFMLNTWKSPSHSESSFSWCSLIICYCINSMPTEDHRRWKAVEITSVYVEKYVKLSWWREYALKSIFLENIFEVFFLRILTLKYKMIKFKKNFIFSVKNLKLNIKFLFKKKFSLKNIFSIFFTKLQIPH